MKTIKKLFLFSLFGILIVSCSKQEDEDFLNVQKEVATDLEVPIVPNTED